jgi:uncharacterized protein YkwD
MWQRSRTRQTQRIGIRRRNHLGLLACLCAAVFAGVLLGRLTDPNPPGEQIFLNDTSPPTTAAAVPTPKKQPQAQRIPRAAGTAPPSTRLGRAPSKALTPSPRPRADDNRVMGEHPDDPTQVLGGDQVRLAPDLAGRVVTLTNAARAGRGCDPLRVDGRLTRSARVHALSMARTGQLDHDSPDGSSPWDRMESAGYSQGAAENIGSGYSTADEAVDGWMANPSHRQNILNCSIRAIGVGVATGSTGLWWTQDFGYR